MTETLFRWAIQPYERPFKTPLKTHHGSWAVRQGLFVLLQSQASGEVGVGEIAPLPWFGTETLEEAIAFSHAWPQDLTVRDLQSIPSQLPASQFGWGTALESVLSPHPTSPQLEPHQVCGLLPAGQRALEAWPYLWHQGHRTFKWKIGVSALNEELSWFTALMSGLPAEANVRLDANGGLTVQEAIAWLNACDSQSVPTVEFLEQPLPPSQFTDMVQLAEDFVTPIALDESVATLEDIQACANNEWPGLYVCKLAIMGFPWEIRDGLSQISNPKVFSSVFEAEVGRNAALSLAADLNSSLALGFGVDHWLAESPKVSINSSTFS